MLVVLAVTAALPYCRVYDVEPFRNCVGTQIQGDVGIHQTLRMTADSLVKVSIFVGEMGNGEAYDVQIEDEDENAVASGGAAPTRSWYWMDIPLDPDEFNKPVRGKLYKVVFTRPTTGEPISFAYDSTDPYIYGSMSVGQDNEPLKDLALRVTGVMRPKDSSYWAFNFGPWEANPALREVIAARAEYAGVRADRMGLDWERIEATQGTFDFSSMDAELAYAHGQLSCDILGLLLYCPKWASSRVDLTWVPGDTWAEGYWRFDTCTRCPPRNLFLGVWDDSNHWARYVQAVVQRYNSMIDLWEAWNEGNLTSKYWQTPDSFYTIGGDTARSMCRLYVRLCAVADSVLDSVETEEAADIRYLPTAG